MICALGEHCLLFGTTQDCLIEGGVVVYILLLPLQYKGKLSNNLRTFLNSIPVNYWTFNVIYLELCCSVQEYHLDCVVITMYSL